MATVTVESRVTAGGRLEPSLDPVILELLEQDISVAELIRRTVEEQVRVLLARMAPECEAKGAASAALSRQYGREVRTEGTAIDAGEEVRRALQAFEHGHFMIVIGGQPAGELREKLTFAPGTTIRFVRLTPLVGG